MTRRVVPRKVLPGKVRQWVKACRSEGLLGAYRNRYHLSWACAIVELSTLGVPFPPEQLEEANRRAISSALSVQARKNKKVDKKKVEALIDQYPWPADEVGAEGIGVDHEFADHCFCWQDEDGKPVGFHAPTVDECDCQGCKKLNQDHLAKLFDTKVSPSSAIDYDPFADW